MDAQRDRVLHWICTGKHVIKTGYQKPPKGESDLETDLDDDAGGSASSPTSSSVPDRLTGADNDPFIPTSADIDHVFQAESLPRHGFPPGLGDPSIMLKDVPALPRNPPRRGVVVGQPLWHIPDPEPQEAQGCLDFQYVHGLQKYFHLSYSTPIECCLSPRPPRSDNQPWATQKGLPLLTLCWSY